MAGSGNRSLFMAMTAGLLNTLPLLCASPSQCAVATSLHYHAQGCSEAGVKKWAALKGMKYLHFTRELNKVEGKKSLLSSVFIFLIYKEHKITLKNLN